METDMKNKNNNLIIPIVLILGIVGSVLYLIFGKLPSYNPVDNKNDNTIDNKSDNTKTDDKLEINFSLLGNIKINIFVGSKYIEPGYKAIGTDGKDYKNKVVVKSNLNTNKEGQYVITYTLNYKDINKTLKRTINVVSKERIRITFNLIGSSEITLVVGSKYNEPGFNATGTDGKDYKKNVTVSGSVNSNKVGKYTIKYRLKIGSIDKTLTRIVNVVNKDIPVTSIKTDKDSYHVYEGKSISIKTTIIPSNATNKTLSWESSNTGIAKVSNGKVQGIKEGNATITIKDSSNNVTKTVKVTVKKQEVIKKSNKIHFIKQSTDSMAPGDAILLESDGHFAMIDTGLGNTKDKNYVYNYLKNVGVTKLDFILLTHIHEDHAAGTINLLNKFPVGRLYTKTYISKYSGDEDYTRFTKIIKKAKAKNVPITYIEKSFKDGEGFDFQSMNIRLYNTKQLKFDDENGNSVLEFIKVNGYRILLTGDLSSESDNKTYIKKLSKKSDFKNLDVLKMPHHGFTSCAFKVNYDAAKNLNPKHIIVTGFSDGCDVVFKSKIPRYYTKNSRKKAIVFTFDNGIKVSK